MSDDSSKHETPKTPEADMDDSGFLTSGTAATSSPNFLIKDENVTSTSDCTEDQISSDSVENSNENSNANTGLGDIVDKKNIITNDPDSSNHCSGDAKQATAADIYSKEELKNKEVLNKDIEDDFSDGHALEKCKIDDASPSERRTGASHRLKRGSDVSDNSDENGSKNLEENEMSVPTDAKKIKTSDASSDESNEFKDANEQPCESGGTRNSGLRSYSDLTSDEDDVGPSSETSSFSLSSESDTVPISSDGAKEKVEEEEAWLGKDISDLPFPQWNSVCSLRERQTLACTRYWTSKVCGSLAMTKRLELQWKLDKHDGCVNALHFNQSGTLLASGSDDLHVMLWDWKDKFADPVISYDSGHRSNVFQAKFLPNCGDSSVVSSARDGQVRVADISSTGSCRGTKKVAQHRGSAHKLSVDVASRSTLLSCGEDGVVFGIDLRLDKPAEKLVTTKVANRRIPLYSIHNNPGRPHEFAVSGRDFRARIYDRRMLLTNEDSTEPVKLFCPHHLEDVSNVKGGKILTAANITCLVYNWCGSELLCSYNDEDIYLFDTSHSSGADYIRRYKGHRNNATVKGVNFYGPRSEFVVSGSDCGNIFFWEKRSSRVVQLMEGDDGGVVNVLEPHPSFPILATSGLDHEVKIWAPTASGVGEVNEMSRLKECMLTNKRDREQERQGMSSTIDGHLMWFLMRTLRGRRRTERREGEEISSEEDDAQFSSGDSSDSEDEGIPRCTQS
ncbi:DDB1- and CUL4-associated factor 8-like isoform X1 [Ciona intestinalis]